MASTDSKISVIDSTDNSKNTKGNVGTNMESSPFDIQKLKEQQKLNEQQKSKRGRKPKQKSMTNEEKMQVFGPVFSFANEILIHFDIKPMTDEQIKQGIIAWEPLASRYLPKLDKYAIFIAPTVWTTGIVLERLNDAKAEKQKLLELQKPVESNAGNT